jgi:hypothetical protein
MQAKSKIRISRSTAALTAAIAGIGFTTAARATTYSTTAFEGAGIEPGQAYQTASGAYLELRGATESYPDFGILDFNAGSLGIPQGQQVTGVNSDLNLTLYIDDYYEPPANQSLTFYLATDTNSAEVTNGSTLLSYESPSTYVGGLNAPGQTGSFAPGTLLNQIGTATYVTNQADGTPLTANLTLTSAEEAYIQGQINTSNTVRIVITTAETDSNDTSFYSYATSTTAYKPSLAFDLTTAAGSSNTSKLYINSPGTKTASVNVGTYLTDHGSPQYCVLQGGSATTTVTLGNSSSTSGDNLTYVVQTQNTVDASATITSPGPEPIAPGSTAQATVGFGPADTNLEAGNTITGTATFANASNYATDTTPVTVNLNSALVLQERHVDSLGSSTNSPTAAPNVGKVLVGTTGSTSASITTDNPVGLTDYSNDALTTLTLNANQAATPYYIDDYFTKKQVGTISATSPSYSQTFDNNETGTVTASVAVAISGQYGNDSPVVEGGVTQTYAPNYTTFGQAAITGDGLQGEKDSMDVYVQWTGYQPASVSSSLVTVTPNSTATATLTNAATNDNTWVDGNGVTHNNGLRAAAIITGTGPFNQSWNSGGWSLQSGFTTGTQINGSQSVGDPNSYTTTGTIGFTTNAQMINGTYGATMTVGLENEQDIQGAAPDDLGNLTINVQSTVTSNPSTQSGNYVLNGGTLSAPATKLTGSFTQSGGTATFAGITGTGTLTINGGTTMLATGSGASTVNSLTISSSGVFDMGNNKLYIDYGGGSDPISTIAGYLKTGSIDTSAPLTFNGLKYGLGFADSADKGNPAGLASGQVEVMYTLLGDANLDGTVNGEDFTILASNFNQSVTSWDQGDFNYDGTVNGEDFTLLAANFNQQVNGAASAGDIAAMDAFAAANGITLPTTSSVPEPASGVLALFGAGILARRARRRDDR